MASNLETKNRQAQHILRDFGFDQERTNERSALVLLALLAVHPGKLWADAEAPMLGTRASMDFMEPGYPYLCPPRPAGSGSPTTSSTVR
jgi:hypothetical protein